MRISAGIVSYTISILHGLGSVPGNRSFEHILRTGFLSSHLVTNNRIHTLLRYILHVSYVTLLASMVKRINRW